MKLGLWHYSCTWAIGLQKRQGDVDGEANRFTETWQVKL